MLSRVLATVMLAVSFGCSEGAQSRTGPEPLPVPTLTLRQAKALSDAKLVRKALEGLAAAVVEVDRPPEFMDYGPLFSNAGLTLQPRPSTASKGICVVQTLNLEQRVLGAPGGEDPPTAFDRVSLSETYKVVSEPDYLDPASEQPNDTEALCSRLTSSAGAIGASEHGDEAVVLDAWKLFGLAASQARSPQGFRLDCEADGQDCRKVLQALDRSRITRVERGCDDLDSAEVPLPQGSTCVGLTFFDKGDPGTSYLTWDVRVIGKIEHLPFRGSVERVLMFHNQTVVD